MVYFAEGHVDKTDFAAAVCQIRKTASVLPCDIHYMHSDIERGRYGIGRRFWNGKIKNSEPVTVWIQGLSCFSSRSVDRRGGLTNFNSMVD